MEEVFMKRFAVFVFLLLLIPVSLQARTLDEIKKAGVIKIAADGQTPPFNYYKGKDLVGWEVDLGNEIAKRLEVKAEWVVQPFNTLLIAIKEDRFDLIATSHAKTAKRAAVVDFLAPHYCTGAMIVSKEGGPKTVAELKGKVVVTPVGTVYYDKLKTIPGIKEVRTVLSETDGLQNLLAGRADAWVTEMFVAKEGIKAHKEARLGLGENILPQENAMVVAKGNVSLKGAADKILKDIVKDGTYFKLMKKYFDENIECK
jgi:polar amino acid transport system substrate-binding protein